MNDVGVVMNIYCVSFFHYNECFHLVLWVVDLSFCENELGGYELLGILCEHKTNDETIIFNIDLICQTTEVQFQKHKERQMSHCVHDVTKHPLN